MNNEELEKRILEVLNKAIGSICVGHENRRGWLVIAVNALVSAGIGDVKEAEHRASVIQLALKNACEIVFSQEIDDEDWDDVIFNYKKEKGIREIGITPNILYDYLKEQDEKELAEERKDEN